MSFIESSFSNIPYHKCHFPGYFFDKYSKSLSIVLTEYIIPTASKLCLADLIREIFLQIRGIFSLDILTHASNPCTYETSRLQHGLYPSLNCSTVTKKKSLEIVIKFATTG